MRIKWLGHSSFLITSDSGTRIITDPYTTSDAINYGKIKETADIVTVSHDHLDHNNVASVQGNPEVIRQSTEAKGIVFRGIPTHHDESGGSERGTNTIFFFEIDGVNICHLGDLGHELSDAQIADLGQVDVLFIPVGGFFTIDAGTAGRLSDRLQPRVILPMHYKTDKCGLPISGTDEFLEGRDNINRLDAGEVELKRETLPAATHIIVLKPSL